MRKLVWLGALVAGLVGPVVRAAPPSVKVGGQRTVADVVAGLRATGLAGRDLADAAVAAVAAEYTHYSIWHLWESPGQSLAQGRGWSQQYNTVLRDVLRALGFEADLVHAARVRGWRNPWWSLGHTWVKVSIDGRRQDACASQATNRVGEVGFVPVTAELPFRPVTRVGVALALVPFVTLGVWRAWLTGHAPSPWIYRPR